MPPDEKSQLIRRGGAHRHRRDGDPVVAEDRVDDADEILDADERAAHVVARNHAASPRRPGPGPTLGEPGYRVAFAAHALTDDDPAEPDRRVLGPPGLDELVESRFADRVGAEARATGE